MAVIEQPQQIVPEEPQIEPAPAPKRQDPRRDYVVLMSTDQPDTWIVVGRANGTREEALDEVVDSLPEDQQGNEFVPVPVRSWKPGSRETETIVKSRWS